MLVASKHVILMFGGDERIDDILLPKPGICELCLLDQALYNGLANWSTIFFSKLNFKGGRHVEFPEVPDLFFFRLADQL